MSSIVAQRHPIDICHIEGNQQIDSRAEASVTIGIPVFNGENTIRQSVDSVLKQSHGNLRVSISDNASTDGTKEACLAMAEEDGRVDYRRQERNIGVFSNYNAAFLNCDSRYFKWQSSSDWCEPEFVKACVDVLESDPTVVLACPQVLLVGESGDVRAYGDDFSLEMDDPFERFRYLLRNIRLCNLFNGLIRTDALQKSILNRSFLGSDVVLLAELALKGKFVLIPKPLWYRRMTPATSSMLKSGKDRDEFFSGMPSDYESRNNWKTMISLFEVVSRSRIGISAKLRCYSHLVKMARWRRHHLWRELLRTR